MPCRSFCLKSDGILQSFWACFSQAKITGMKQLQGQATVIIFIILRVLVTFYCLLDASTSSSPSVSIDLKGKWKPTSTKDAVSGWRTDWFHGPEAVVCLCSSVSGDFLLQSWARQAPCLELTTVARNLAQSSSAIFCDCVAGACVLSEQCSDLMHCPEPPILSWCLPQVSWARLRDLNAA